MRPLTQLYSVCIVNLNVRDLIPPPSLSCWEFYIEKTTEWLLRYPTLKPFPQQWQPFTHLRTIAVRRGRRSKSNPSLQSFSNSFHTSDISRHGSGNNYFSRASNNFGMFNSFQSNNNLGQFRPPFNFNTINPRQNQCDLIGSAPTHGLGFGHKTFFGPVGHILC